MDGFELKSLDVIRKRKNTKNQSETSKSDNPTFIKKENYFGACNHIFCSQVLKLISLQIKATI